MSFLKDAGKTFIKFSETVVEKTEEYTRIAKLILDIKKLENAIESLHNDIGQYVVKRINEGASSIGTADEPIKGCHEKISENKKLIDAKRHEIEMIKKARNAPKEKDTQSGEGFS